MVKAFAEIPIDPKQVRSYQDLPRLIEDHGCPRCQNFLIAVKIKNFSLSKLRFENTCQNCGMYYLAQKVDTDSGPKLYLFEEEEDESEDK
ncbi:MAG: hypothetical protein ACTSRW_05585 [Candidatus Helarchaeota archaeon]